MLWIQRSCRSRGVRFLEHLEAVSVHHVAGDDKVQIRDVEHRRIHDVALSHLHSSQHMAVNHEFAVRG